MNNVTNMITREVEPIKIQPATKEEPNLDRDEFVSRRELDSLKENFDLKIQTAIQPLEGKIDNLPTQFENLLLKEREYQDNKAKETRRYIVGTIGIGVLSIIVSVVLYFI